MLRLIPHTLQPHQQLITNVGSKVYGCTREKIIQKEDLVSEADEADLRVWLHCKKSAGVNKLIFSPDTDVYNIGLSLMSHFPECHVIVQLSRHTDERARYLDMNNLINALQNDPDLSLISPHIRPQVLQAIYVSTGCDYTSFFHGLGKVTFLTTFFKHATFIAGGQDPPGSLGNLTEEGEGDECSMAKFSFLRLIGCAYYKQHCAAFRTPTPQALYHSIKGGNISDHHSDWLAIIRNTTIQRVDTESKSMPSTASLLLHWKRSEWILRMWKCATCNTMDLPGMHINNTTIMLKF